MNHQLSWQLSSCECSDALRENLDGAGRVLVETKLFFSFSLAFAESGGGERHFVSPSCLVRLAGVGAYPARPLRMQIPLILSGDALRVRLV